MIHINWNYINGSVEIEEKSREAEENYFFAQIVKLSNFSFATDFYMAAEVRYYCFFSLLVHTHEQVFCRLAFLYFHCLHVSW